MIDELEFIQIFRIDLDRLNSYYERIKNQFQGFTPIQIIAKFLNGQSIGTSMYDVIIVLEYYQHKINDEKTLLDFAFEWIRAKQIRFHYTKFLANAQFPDYEIAVDASIFLFFQQYDIILRQLFKSEIKEYEISSLYEIFFSPIEANADFNKILEDQKNQVPTIFRDTNRIDIKIYTLRKGLSNIIKKDFNKTIIGR
jgi:hypothetical protein